MIHLDKVRWGFIGCGDVTETKSGPAFNMIPGSEIVAVMSRDKEKAASYAKRHNIPRWYNDPQLLIGDEDVNAIYIATPPSSHATYAIMAMKAGKPVYIEKPMAASYEDCARINRISKETGIPCFVAYYRRYLPYFIKVKEVVKDEKGEVQELICTYDPLSKGGNSPDGRKVKGTIQWVDASNCISAQVNMYDKLFLTSNPGDLEDYLENLNPESLVILKDCKMDADLVNAKVGDSFQFMRHGYFTVDKNSSDGNIIFNLTASLKDSYKPTV